MNEPTGQQVGSVPGAIRTHDHRIKRTSDADAPERTPTDAGDAGATPGTGFPSETRDADAPGGPQVGSGLRPYYADAHVTIYHGDVLDVLPLFTPSQIDGVVSDPPYASGGRMPSQARGTISKAESRDDAEWFLGDNMGADTYLWWMREISRGTLRASTYGSHAYVFTDWRQYSTLVAAWESVGWTLRSVVVWDKARGGAMGSFWRNNHEWIAVFAKGAPRPLPNGGFFNTWQGVKPQGGAHPTEKPVALMARLIEAASPELPILDPFMGSGTTLVAAKSLGRKAIGIEVDERYCEIAARRLSQEVLDFGGAA